MSKDEFLFLIPGVLYGIAVFDLLSLVRNKKVYWESILWAAMLFFTLIVILFNLYGDLEVITSNIFYYTLFLFSPILFVQSCYLLAPEKSQEDMKTIFFKNLKPFFLSLSGVVAVNLLINFLIHPSVNYIQSALFLILFGLSAFLDKLYLRLLSAALLLTVVIRFYVQF